MKIHDIQVERFGVWQDLSLPLSDPGVSVFYGPNEAGKSTLMRFVRAILYGYHDRDERSAGPERRYRSCAGALRVVHNQAEYLLRRESVPGTRGRLSINGNDHDGMAEERLQRLIGSTSEEMYESIFAIGLEELQELATLSGTDVSRHIYGLSLGPEGRRILNAQQAAHRETNRLFDPEHQRGLLADLSRQLEEIDRDLDEIHNSEDKLTKLAERRHALTIEIDRQRDRQTVLQRNLRGYQFLDRVHAPWSRQRELRRELESIPLFNGIGDDAIARLDEIDLELEETLTRRNRLMAEVRQLEIKAEQSTIEPALEEQVCTIRNLLERQDEVKRIEQKIQNRSQGKSQRKAEIQRNLDELGTQLSIDRVDRFDASAAALSTLLRTGDAYRKTLMQRSRTVRLYKKGIASSKARISDFDEQAKLLGKATIPQAKAHARRRLAEMEQLVSLRNTEERLAETQLALEEQLRFLPEHRDLPPYFYLVLWVFGLTGLLLFVFGMVSLPQGSVRGGNTAWIVGLVYMLLGVCCGAVTYTMKQHFAQYLGWDGGRLQRRLRETQDERQQTIATIERMTDENENRKMHALLAPRADEPSDLSEFSVIDRIRRRLGELDRFEEEEKLVIKRKRRLSQLKDKLQVRQRAVASARREWSDTLRRLGLAETLRVPDALHTWQQVAEVQHAWQELQWEDHDRNRDQETVEAFHSEVTRLARLIPGTTHREGASYQTLIEWERRLKQVDEQRRERLRLLSEARRQRNEAEQLDGKIETCRARRISFLSRAGAADRDELVSRIKAMQRRGEITRLLEAARRDVDAATKSEPELAVVEEDLIGFDASLNARNVAKSREELKDLEKSLQQAHEEIGRIRRDIQHMEEDASLEALSRKRKRVATELKEATSRWGSAQLAGLAIERVRHRVERHCQPRTLQLASEFLERLTLGKYHNVWAPLGDKKLIIDDDHGQSFHVEHLSSGTREQLFLAVRMAVIREFAENGVQLPMVLDDVFVNFDQTRTDAAVEALLDFADDGQQILFFTCHLHLAHMFESKGSDPIWLPGHSPAVVERVG
ncbi:MAG: AAA family ATPase [Planctomycetaceae bacterium]